MSVNEVSFVVAWINDHKPNMFKECFLDNPYIPKDRLIDIHNVEDKHVSAVFNTVIDSDSSKFKGWFAFCHEDWFLQEDLKLKMQGKNTLAVYGPIGASWMPGRYGMIIWINPISRQPYKIGWEIEGNVDVAVQTLDDMCIIIHFDLFEKGFRFDIRFDFQSYGHDFCMQMRQKGFPVYATQIKCQHRCKYSTGDVWGAIHEKAYNLFKQKWQNSGLFPVRTTSDYFE